MSVSFGKVTITEVACALILGILTNVMLKNKEPEAEPATGKKSGKKSK